MTIDDVPIALERLLEEEGFSTMTDWSGKEALALSDQAQFDLWLVDEHGADVNSNALLSQLRLRQPGASLLVMHSGRQGSHNPRVASSGMQMEACRGERRDPARPRCEGPLDLVPG